MTAPSVIGLIRSRRLLVVRTLSASIGGRSSRPVVATAEATRGFAFVPFMGMDTSNPGRGSKGKAPNDTRVSVPTTPNEGSPCEVTGPVHLGRHPVFSRTATVLRYPLMGTRLRKHRRTNGTAIEATLDPVAVRTHSDHCRHTGSTP